MVIAADIKGSATYRRFIIETFNRLCDLQPSHRFLLTGEGGAPGALHPSLDYIPLQPLLRGSSLRRILKKQGVEILVSAKTATLPIPQVVYIDEENINARIQPAQQGIVPSQVVKKKLLEINPIRESNIHVIYPGHDDTRQKMDEEERERVKKEVAGGNEFFAVFVRPDLFMPVLKAFSAFKKMQKSSMQLVLMADRMPGKEFSARLGSYRYREEVKWLAAPQSGYAFAAYAIIDTDGAMAIPVMQAAVPLITADDERMRETGGASVLYCDPADPAALSGCMMQVYKDEKLRGQMINAGREEVKKYSWQAAAGALWQCIGKAYR